MLRNYPDQLLADFQQYYGLNAVDIGHDITLRRAATLLMQLPPSCRVFKAMHPASEWLTPENQLLRDLANTLRSLAGAKNFIELPGMSQPQESSGFTVDQAKQILTKQRTPTQEGGDQPHG